MSDEQTGDKPSESEGQTLEQIASEFSVQQSQPAKREAEPAAQPEFTSTEEGQKWLTTELAKVTGQLNTVNDEMADTKAKAFVETQDKAVNKAIESIKKDVAIPDSFIEGRLHVKYSRDEAFRKIFDNREQNPDAYQRALGVVASELKEDSQWAPDPQKTENSRALKDLQKSANRASATDDPNERFKKMPAAEFSHEWEKILRG